MTPLAPLSLLASVLTILISIPTIASTESKTASTANPMEEYAGMIDALRSEKAQANLLMKQINDTFHRNIDELSYTVGNETFPLIIIHSNSSHKDKGTFNYTLYKRDGSIESIPAHTPEETHIKYIIHHVPAILAIVLPEFQDHEADNNPGWMTELQQLDNKIVAIDSCIHQTDISEPIIKMLQSVLGESHLYIQNCLKERVVSEEEFNAYTSKIKPTILQILGAATKGFSERTTAVFARWQTEVGDDEWKNVQVIVQTSLALRVPEENPYLQPLQAFLGETFREDQIIITTNTAFTDEQLRDELGHYFASKLVASFILPTHPGEK
ncbi:MAG: hypothetical protein AAFX93_01265 [Verrucomicrobiota bacterium]